MAADDREANRFSARATRYARVGANMGGVAARMAGARLFGGEGQNATNAAALSTAKAAEPGRNAKAVATRRACTVLFIFNFSSPIAASFTRQDIIPCVVKGMWQ